MHQQEIQFFWPLTEQIPLDLNYRECNQYQISCSSANIGSGAVLSVAIANGSTSWTPSSIKLQENHTTMVVLKKPNFIRKFLFKTLGIKWEIK